jgi:multicomponent Na+:H+ antiporter subunit F
MSLWIVVILIGIGILLSAIRLFKGPSTMDRLVGIDTINMIVVGLIGVLALIFKSSLYLDIAIVYGVLAFLETVIVARYMEGRQ